ncbi:MAG: hypothetical protein EXS05_15380 [Planctomycetaceae bacterium]|nr:hypothetical protein [Planctomycetaceae bacterium]
MPSSISSSSLALSPQETRAAIAFTKKNTLSRAEFAGTEKDSLRILRQLQAGSIARNSTMPPRIRLAIREPQVST